MIGSWDPRGDFFKHSAGTPASGPGWADIRNASLSSGRGTLALELELYEPVPIEPEAIFASWHFVLDLDGRRSTGHPGGEPPVGVFPDLGVDLWADVIWDGHRFQPYLFLGPHAIDFLVDTPGLLEVEGRDDRKTVHFELPVPPLEEIFSDLYGTEFAVDEDRIEWVAVTNYAADFVDFEDPPSDFFPDRLYLPEGSCQRAARDGRALCLNGGRFQVEVEWEDHRGHTGSGRVVPFAAADSGLFWFFDPENWELLVKVLDGCGFNDRFWVFSAATTDVEYTLRVTDTRTGEVREYFNPLGNAADAITDTGAFATCSSP